MRTSSPRANAAIEQPSTLEHIPPPKLLDIDWATVTIANEADARALWNKIAPTGLDWEDKLGEIPEDAPLARQLALALLHEGNFVCVPPSAHQDCVHAPVDIPAPVASATLADPCLRRNLALWAIVQLEDADLPQARDALRAIAAIPPPESQLVAAAFHAIPESDLAERYELLAIAWKAGQTELVNGSLGALDEPHLIEAVQKLHSDGALQVLSAEGFRAVYLAAVLDEKMATVARTQAMTDLVATADKLAPDVQTMLVAATKSPDCTVAATAARMLDQHGLHQFAPKPSAAKPLRALCVLASFEQLQRNDEASRLANFVPARGLELIKISYDAWSEVDADGDGDPHTEHEINLIPRAEAVLPEIDEIVRAFQHCTGSICRTDDHEVRFTFKAGYLTRLELADRPPCSHHE
ncbi:MAG: hypothetical protein JWO36_835 [Myxococcales bacterium]|nr:hypothetical protein [Myxococcales bacterium]